MNGNPKQVIDVRPGKGFTTAQSDEHQRRWSEKAWDHAIKNGNYDRSREHLNFEVAKGGVIQAVDKSKTIPERIAEQVDKRGLVDKNRGLKTPRFRTVANLIFTGNAQRMRELGFGAQSIDFNRGADNSHLTRQQDIEKWALDMYKYACEQWGEENIVQFICHMDESSPHIHCTVLPIDERNYLSFKKVFAGDDRFEFSRRIKALHDKLAVVNEKWGLARGTKSGARNVPHEDYHRRLQNENAELERSNADLRDVSTSLRDQIRQAEKRVKGLTTMIHNAEAKYAKLLDDIEALEQKLKVAGGEHESMLAELEAKRAELRDVKEHIADKRDKLDDANRILDELKAQTDSSRQRLNLVQEHLKKAETSLHNIAKGSVAIASMETMVREFKRAFSSMSSAQDAALFDESLVKDLAENGTNILVCAWMLFGNFVDEATEFAHSQGGGGTTNDLPWGRKEDEDDRRWAYRCLNQARKMMKPPGRKLRR